jgi:hypothetical protein
VRKQAARAHECRHLCPVAKLFSKRLVLKVQRRTIFKSMAAGVEAKGDVDRTRPPN